MLLRQVNGDLKVSSLGNVFLLFTKVPKGKKEDRENDSMFGELSRYKDKLLKELADTSSISEAVWNSFDIAHNPQGEYTILNGILEPERVYDVDPAEKQGSYEEIKDAIGKLEQTIPKEDLKFYQIQLKGFSLEDISIHTREMVKAIFLQQKPFIDAYRAQKELKNELDEIEEELKKIKGVGDDDEKLTTYFADEIEKNEKQVR